MWDNKTFLLFASVAPHGDTMCIPKTMCFHINILKPSGYMMHQNIQQLYVLPPLYLCVLYLSENKQQLVLLTA